MKNTLITKSVLVDLWNKRCEIVPWETSFERSGTSEDPSFSIIINEEISLMLFQQSIKIIFESQIEYTSEELSPEEFIEMTNAFDMAEEKMLGMRKDAIISRGVKALERILPGVTA